MRQNNMDNIYLVYFTQAGEQTCRRIREALTADGCRCQSSDGRRLAGGLRQWTQEAFSQGEALVFVSATGIAVRAIAPFLRSKTEDPAVIVTDERGIHVISLLSGHMGGANRLTLRIAEAIGGQPVITTATDVSGRFAVDQWAKDQDLAIADMKIAKEVSAALLRKEECAFYSEFPTEGTLPRGLRRWNRQSEETGETKPPDICIAVSLERPKELPFQKILWLIPRVLTLGIGCRRGTSQEQIRAAAEGALSERGLSLKAVRRVASIDIKKDEQGLADFAGSLGVPFTVYTAEELENARLAHGQSFSPSNFVRSVTGVDNVCERAAILSAAADGGGVRPDLRPELMVRKTAGGGVTVAAACLAEMEGRPGVRLKLPEADAEENGGGRK